MSKRIFFIALVVVLVAFSIYCVIPNSPGINFLGLQRDLKTVLGLDLQGGMQVLLEVPQDIPVTASALDDARKILENRSNGLGVSEVVFQVAGTRRIVGEFPGLTDTEQVVSVLKETGQLEFVDTQGQYIEPGTLIKTDLGNGPVSGETTAPVATDQVTTSEGALANVTSPSTDQQEIVYHTVMTGDQLSNVSVQTGQLKPYVVAFNLKEEGAKIFAEFTTNNVGKYLALVLDKRVISCPSINSAITEGEGIIEGQFTYETANNLAVQLRYGSLPIPLEVLESRVVGPTLGQDSLQKSLIAGVVGFIIITLFMLIYYRLPGGVAVISIMVFGLLTLAVYKLIPVTLTLPGIAGFLLSTGGALDANILIFERLKEELRSGRKLSQAVELGWKRAWPSIRDSNIATFITSAILFWFGSAYGATTVKGFAFTLAIGVLLNFFTAIVVTRALLSEVLNLVKTKNFARWFGI